MTAITIVDPFEVTGESIDQAIELWDKYEDYYKNQKGLISARLLKSHDSKSKFNLVVISEWESKESYEAAISYSNNSEVAAPETDLIRHRASYDTIRNV